jgi:RNA polymerase sigma-70 factor (ECF subfamily)
MERPPREAEPLLAEIEDVYRHRYRTYLRFALAFLGDREQAHDAVQETFARAIRGRSTYRGAGSLDGWLWRTLTNHCRDLLRARRAAGASAPELAASVNHQPGEHAELRAALARLPERQRLVVFLRHYADLGYDQIAEAVGVERGTVAAALHAAHASLRRTMEESAA